MYLCYKQWPKNVKKVQIHILVLPHIKCEWVIHILDHFFVWLLLQHFSSQHSGLKMSKKCKQIILKVRICVGQYPTQLTVTLQNCRKFWSNIFVTFLVVFALFFANSTTVMVALVAKATCATITVVSFAKNSAKTTRNVT